MALDRENLERKLRGLRALLAPGSGAVPGERAAAARLAAALERQLAALPRTAPLPVYSDGLTMTFTWSSASSDGEDVIFTSTDPSY